MQTTSNALRTRAPNWSLAAAGLTGLAVAAALAAYSSVHPGHGAALLALGFHSMLSMKAWLTTIAGIFVVIQVVSALAIWGKLPGVSSGATALPILHRWSGTAAFVISLPVAFHCVWSIGFSTFDTRTLIHSAAGCLFYGVFAAKMLSLRIKRLPGWVLPVLGGFLAALFTTVWFTAAFWYFSSRA